MNNFKKSGHINEETISLYVDALMLDNIEIIPEQVISHVENCAGCKKEIIEVIEIMKEAKIHAEKIQIPNKKVKEDNKIGRSLLTILLLFSLGYIFMNLITVNSNETNLNQNDNLIINPPSQVVEMEYTPNEEVIPPEVKPVITKKVKRSKKRTTIQYHISYNLESLVETNFRSNSIRVIAPKVAQQFRYREKISFNFVNTLKKSLFIKILNNKEENVFTTDFKGDSYKLNQSLKPGLYYWKLETEDDLLYVGKFLVK